MVVSLFFCTFATNIKLGNNMFGFIIIICVMVITWLFMELWDEKQQEKCCELERVAKIQKNVIDYLSDIEKEAEYYGGDFHASLLDFANKMDKMSSDEVKKHLKPYDIYNLKALSKNFSTIGRIVIDANLVPKFIATVPSSDKNIADIELSVALTSDEVRGLAEKCNKIFLEKEIEIFRKNKVNDLIDGEKNI